MSPQPRDGFDENELAPWDHPGPRMMSTRADTITPSRPVWLWERWLSAGALHILVGRQGGGKSTFAAWLTAQVTTGRPYPDDTTVREPVNVATLSLEEAADRLVARLHAAGADVGLVDVLADVEDVDDEGRTFRRPWRLPKDCSVLETYIRDGRIRLLVVDGLGYSIVGDSHNYAVVGSALSALAGVAERTGCAVVGLTHPPKGASDPVTAAIGSTAWTAIPRVVWVLGADPEDETETRRVCRVSKTNYRPPDNGLGFVIGNDERYECGYVTGLGTSTVTAEVLMSVRQTEGERSEREETRDLIESVLGAGPMDTADVLKATRAAGVSDATVKRARRDLGVTSTPRKDGTTGKLLGWSLALPDHRITPPDHGVSPQGQPLIDPVDPLVPTRTYIESRGPEDPQDERGPLVGLFAGRDGPPPPDDDLFFDAEDGA
jgi:putative DNA primase/helicase